MDARFSLLLPLALAAACSAGARGGSGEGAAACIVEAASAGWQITCPDGTTATLAPQACAISDENGAQVIRCADGEAVVLPGGTLGDGAIRGVVHLEGTADASGALVEIEGTGRAVAPAADGTFAFEDVPAGVYSLEVSLAPWKPTRVENVLVLPGTFDVGTVELSLTRALGLSVMPEAIDEAAQLALVDGLAPTVVDLVTDETWTVRAPGVDSSVWHAGTLEIRGFSPRALGLWTRYTGLAWFADFTWFDVRPGAALAMRDASVHVLRPDGSDQAIDVAPIVWTSSGLHAAWVVGTTAGTVLIDATGDVVRTQVLTAGQAADAVLDDRGMVAALRFGDTWQVHDVTRTRVVGETPSPGGVSVGDGIASWRDADGDFGSYDATTGITWVRPAGGDAAWSPAQRWVTWRDEAGDAFVQPRDGSAAVALGDVPFGPFSPGERRMAAADGGLRVVDLETGAVQVVEGVTPDWCIWIDDAWLACMDGQEMIGVDGARALVAGTASGVEELRVESGALLYRDDDGWVAARPGGTPVVLPGAIWAGVPRSGDHVAWSSGSGRLVVSDFATGTSHTLSGANGGTGLLLDDVIVFQEPSPLGSITRYAPYP